MSIIHSCSFDNPTAIEHLWGKIIELSVLAPVDQGGDQGGGGGGGGGGNAMGAAASRSRRLANPGTWVELCCKVVALGQKYFDRGRDYVVRGEKRGEKRGGKSLCI